MKFGLNTNSLRKEFSTPDIALAAAAMEVDGIEWGLPKLGEAAAAAREMVRCTRDAGLEVFSFINAAAIWKLDELKVWSEIAAEHHVRNLRVAHPWYAWDYNESLHQPDSFNDLLKRTEDALAPLMELGKEYDVRYVLETHSGSCFASPMAALLLKKFNPAYCGVIYDPANTVLEGFVRPRGAVELLGPYLAYVHAKNLAFIEKDNKWSFEKRPLDRGMVDYNEVAFALKLGGFDGYMSFEELYSAPSGFVDEVRAGIVHLKQCLAGAPSAIQKPYSAFNL